MEKIIFIFEAFKVSHLIVALIAAAVAIGALITGYKGGESSLDWWRKHEGRILSDKEYTKEFNSIVSKKEKEKITLRIQEKDGREIVGTLDALSSSSKGYMYTFKTEKGELVSISFTQLDQVTVLSVEK